MKLLPIVLREIAFRPVSAILTALSCAASLAIVLVVAGVTQFLTLQTQQIQRDIGLNIRIIPAVTSESEYWMRGYSTGSIPMEFLQRVEDQDVANRLVPVLQKAIPWGTGSAILTGIGEERFARGNRKKAVYGSPEVDSYALTVGAAAAQARSLAVGDIVEIRGKRLRVEHILPAEGSRDDNRVHLSLPIVQQLLEMPGQINEIRALECNCDETHLDPEEELRSVLGPILPGTKIIRQDRIADARRQQRQLATRFSSVLSPLMIVLATSAVFGLSWLNTAERRNEFGLFAALGKPSHWILLVNGLRSALLGCCGGLVGGLAGNLVLAMVTGDFAQRDQSWDLQGGMPADFYFRWPCYATILGGLIGILGSLVPGALISSMSPTASIKRK